MTSCNECGNDICPNDVFCSQCGSKIDNESSNNKGRSYDDIPIFHIEEDLPLVTSEDPSGSIDYILPVILTPKKYIENKEDLLVREFVDALKNILGPLWIEHDPSNPSDSKALKVYFLTDDIEDYSRHYSGWTEFIPENNVKYFIGYVQKIFKYYNEDGSIKIIDKMELINNLLFKDGVLDEKNIHIGKSNDTLIVSISG